MEPVNDMKQKEKTVSGRRIFLFRKTHTPMEKAQYIFDPDSPDLILFVNPMIHLFKWTWVALNVAFTIASCGALIWQSFPQYAYYASDLRNMNFLTWVELLCTMFFVIDFVIRFFLTTKKWYIFMLQFSNVVDLLSIVPYFFQVVLIALGVNATIFRVFFVLRMFRIFRLGKYNPGMTLVTKTIKESINMLAMMVICVILILVIMSTAFFYAETEDFDFDHQIYYRKCPEPRWVKTDGEWVPLGYTCVRQPAPYQSIIEAMYWGVVMLTTTGYPIDAPVTTIGRIIALLSSVLGVFFFAAPATVLATNYKKARHKMEEEYNSRRFEKCTIQGMKAQDDLRKELERVWKLRDNKGRVKIKDERILTEVGEFTIGGITRKIYEAIPGLNYVYEPLAVLERKDGKVYYTDDFNLFTAQRSLTCYLITDTPEARAEARQVLENLGFLPKGVSENNAYVGADPMATFQAHHDYEHVYPDLNQVVYFDRLNDLQANNRECRVPIRFIIEMAHMHAVSDVVKLLECTMLHVSMGIRKTIALMHIPLLVDNLMSSRLIQELFIIAHERRSDKSMIAYIHPHDVAQLLEGFCDQFVPTPSSDLLIVAPELVDQQVTAALCSSFPLVKLDWIPPEGANSVYRSQHLNIDSIHDSYLLELNLTTLAQLDNLGYGNRFKIHVPICEQDIKEVIYQLI